MTFTYAIATDLGKLRLAIGDETTGQGVKPSGANFTDEELQVFLAAIPSGGTWRNAVAPVLRTLANQYAVAARSTSSQGVSENLTATAAELRAAAAAYEDNITADGQNRAGVTTGTVTWAGLTYAVGDDGAVA